MKFYQQTDLEAKQTFNTGLSFTLNLVLSRANQEPMKFYESIISNLWKILSQAEL